MHLGLALGPSGDQGEHDRVEERGAREHRERRKHSREDRDRNETWNGWITGQSVRVW